MSLLTSELLAGSLDLPVSLPSTEIDADSWLIVSTLKVDDPAYFALRWLQLQLIEVVDPFTSQSITVTPDSAGMCVFPPGGIELVNPAYGLAYIGLFRGFQFIAAPTLQPMMEPPLSVGGVAETIEVVAARSTTPAVFSTPGLYSFVVVNNTSNRTLRLSASGQVRLTLT